MNSKVIIPLSAVVVVGTITFADLNTNGSMPTTRQWIGIAAIYTTLSIGSDLGFTPVDGFAGLLMLAVFISRGEEAFGYLNQKTGNKKKTKQKEKQHPESQVTSVTQERQVT